MARGTRSAERPGRSPAMRAASAPAPVGLGQPSPPGARAALMLAATMALAPALGVPTEGMLQDTLKSMVVALGALLASLLWLWDLRTRDAELRWHAVLGLPLALMAYALG